MEAQDFTQKPIGIKSVLIFGGSGFIGTHLSRFLLVSGYEVYVADIKNTHRIADIAYIDCDIREPIDIHLANPPKIVINLAAIHRTPGHQPQEYYLTNILGAINVTEWCEKNYVHQIIFTSSIAAYGLSSDQLTEESTLMPNTHYGYSKLMAEEIYKQWYRHNDNVVFKKLSICRPSVIFGPGESGNFTRLARALKRRTFLFPAGPNITKGCGYVKDLVRAIEFSIDHIEQYFVFNFGFPKNYSIGDICDSFSKVANFRRPPNLFVPQFVVQFIKSNGQRNSFFKRATKLTQSSFIRTDKLSKAGFQWNFNLDTALEDWLKESSFDLK